MKKKNTGKPKYDKDGKTKDIMLIIAEHVIKTARTLDDAEIDTMTELIKKSEKIFVLGAGRSGLAARAFAMRLVQLGFTVYVVGETIAPGMKKDDLLIVVSGSGQTRSIVEAAKVAKNLGVTILAITSYLHSPLGEIADHRVVITGKTKIDIEKDHMKHQIQGIHSSLTPLGTLFEDTVLLFFDGVIAQLMTHLKCGEQDMHRRHATIE